MNDTELEQGIEESVKAGHIRRAGKNAKGDQLYALTKKGKRYVERQMMPQVLVPADLINNLCTQADEEAWRRDRLTKEIGRLILSCAFAGAPGAPGSDETP